MNHDDAPDGVGLDQRLLGAHQDLLDGLDDVLDLDAGLVDATLPARSAALIAALDQVIDLDAGLHDILPAPVGHARQRVARRGSLADYAFRFAQRPAHERLIARTWFPLRELTSLCALTTAASLHRTFVSNPTRALVRDLDRAVDRTLAFAHLGALARELDLHLVLLRGFALIRNFALDLALDIVSARHRIHEHDLRRDLDRARALLQALDSAHVRAHVRALDHDHLRDLARALVASLESDDVLKAQVIALGLVKELARAMGTVLDDGARMMRSVVAAASRDNALSAAVVVDEDLAEAVTLLETALADVTNADLSDADLSGVPLAGVLWSSRTRWPATEAEHIRLNSEQIGPDLWQVVRGRERRVDQIM